MVVIFLIPPKTHPVIQICYWTIIIWSRSSSTYFEIFQWWMATTFFQLIQKLTLIFGQKRLMQYCVGCHLSFWRLAQRFWLWSGLPSPFRKRNMTDWDGEPSVAKWSRLKSATDAKLWTPRPARFRGSRHLRAESDDKQPIVIYKQLRLFTA